MEQERSFANKEIYHLTLRKKCMQRNVFLINPEC